MRELAKVGKITYYKVGEASEIDAFKITTAPVVDKECKEVFGYFRGLGIINYPSSFKIWLRKFPRPIFIVAAVSHNEMVSWAYLDDWPDPANDGEQVYALRSIETRADQRSKRIGLRMLHLAFRQASGYIITKPLNPSAERFFRKIGFMYAEEFRNCPIDLLHHSGYMVLTPYNKKKFISESEAYMEKQF